MKPQFFNKPQITEQMKTLLEFLEGNLKTELSIRDEVPVAALISNLEGQILAFSTNSKEQDLDPSAHAEINVIRQVCRLLQTTNLQGLTLLTTLEPCPMCAGAILQAKLSRVVYGAYDSKFGACSSVWDLLRDPKASHHPEVYAGFFEDECSAIISAFFAKLRSSSSSDSALSIISENKSSFSKNDPNI
jgi:tRNA(adenine34) deaminase